MKGTPFKLRSGNNTPFKQMGGDKETAEQYNARVMAEYESKLQSHSDSTASYGAQIKIDKLLGESFEIRKDNPDIFTNPRMDEVYEKRELAKDLHYKNVERGIYTDIDNYKKGKITYKGDDFESGDLSHIGSKNPDDLRPKVEPVKPQLKKIQHSKYYDTMTKEYRVRTYNPTSSGRGKPASDMSLAEWNKRNDE